MGAQDAAPGAVAAPGREETSEGNDGIITQYAASAEVTVVPGSGLQLIARINEAHRLKVAFVDLTIQHAIRCGELLIGQKQQVPHWQFTQWIEQNCTFSVRSAREYIGFAERFQTNGSLPVLSIRQARARRSDDEVVDSTRTDTDASIAIDTAISILDQARLVADHNKLLDAYQSATRELKRLREQLGKGKVAKQNAEASVIQAATRYSKERPQS